MARLLRMPEVAANATEAVLQAWIVAENVPFRAEELIATIETDKALVDVEAEADGVILKTLVAAGAPVDVGAPIAVIGDVSEIGTDLTTVLAELGIASEAPALAPAASPFASASPFAGASTAVATPETDVEADHDSQYGDSADGPTHADRIFASPLARRLARESGVDLSELSGTGPGGRIVRTDIEAALASHAQAEPEPSEPVLVQAPATVTEHVDEQVEPEAIGTSVVVSEIPAPPPASRALSVSGNASPHMDVPHSRMRRAIAARLTESKQTVPHFYVRGSAHVDRLMELREELNQRGDVRISVNDLVIKAAARAHRIIPAMNVVWGADYVRHFSTVDMAVAISTDRGLVTPVLRSVEHMSISTVAATVRDFAERAKSGQLHQEELEGGSFSISNLGMFGTEDFAAIINPPQAAILAVGAVRQEPIVRKDKLKVGSVLRVTLSVDHRPVDGVVAASWMRVFVSLLENPVEILL